VANNQIMIHQWIGWIGAFFFAICAIPQVLQTWKSKKVDGLSSLFLLFWLSGELLTFTYIIVDDVMLRITHFPLYVNYTANIIMVLYLIYAKYHYK
jgi:uncharacterized protein with PQ loop repeat